MKFNEMMRKWILGTLAALTIAGCTTTPEDKAGELLAHAVKKTLYDPDSYEVRETVLDSAFAPMEGPDLMQKVQRLYADKEKIGQMQLALDSLLHAGADKKGINELSTQMEEVTQNIQRESLDLAEYLRSPRTFIGFRAFHTYRAKIHSAEPEVGTVVAYMDPDLLIIQQLLSTQEMMEGMQKLKELTQEKMK